MPPPVAGSRPKPQSRQRSRAPRPRRAPHHGHPRAVAAGAPAGRLTAGDPGGQARRREDAARVSDACGLSGPLACRRVPRVSKVIPLHEAFDGTLGLAFDPTAPDEVCATVEVRDGLCNPFGIVHGGVDSSIAESIATVSTIYRVHRDGGSAIGSTNHTSLLRPISEGAIHARGRALHTGRTSWTWDVEFRDDQGRLCASCRVTIAIRRYTAAPDR